MGELWGVWLTFFCSFVQVFQHLPQLMVVFADAFTDEMKLKPESRVEVVALLRQLQASYPAELQQCVATLSPEHQQALAAALSS